jgi:predicted  nucleic acid-binding Zn-ribbon protein
MKLVDMRCEDCGKVYEDIVYEDIRKYTCRECGGRLRRMFSVRKYPEYPEGLYEHFGHEPVYIRDRDYFYRECKARGLEPKVPKAAINAKKGRKYYT